MCRAELGDRRCRVNMAGRRQVARVIGSDQEMLELNVAEPAPNGWGGGRVRWLEGSSAGVSSPILTSSGATVILTIPPVLGVVTGTQVEVMEGCDKRFATCRDRFANAPNFRGEPHLPGIDLLTRYPGA